MNKKVTMCVISDVSTDQRIQKVAGTLHANGYEITIAGRNYKGAVALPELPYKVTRLRPVFTSGPFLYAEFNIRLFWFLLFHKTGVINANDLDTLPAARLAACLKGLPVVYDSHEYFTGVPEIQNRPLVKKTWQWIERLFFPGLRYIYTVNDSIARIYSRKYKKTINVIRNLPRSSEQIIPVSRKKLGLPEDKNIIILQGSGINIDRGAEEAVDAMHHLENAVLLIIGSGDVMHILQEKVQHEKTENKIRILGRQPYRQLMQYTAVADLGLNLDKDTNPNYRYSLPNKLFDYFRAGIPVLSSRLPETEKIITQYNTGDFIESHDPRHIADKIQSMLSDREKYDLWKENTKFAAKELCWEKQEYKLLEIYQSALTGT